MMEFITNIDFTNTSSITYSHLIWSMTAGGGIVLYILIAKIKLRLMYILTKNTRIEIKTCIAILNYSSLYDEHVIEENFSLLTKHVQKSSYLIQYMIDELIVIQNDLRIPKQLLRQLCEDLDLRKVALKKLMEGDIGLLLKGINELKIVGSDYDVYFVQGFLSHHDMNVRRAARITIAALKPSEALVCLITLMDELDSYEKDCLYNSLKKLPVDQLPDFSVYFDCYSQSAVCFSIDMVAEFHQKATIPLIQKFIFHRSPEVKTCAIRALRSLEEDQSIELEINKPLRILSVVN